MQRSRVPARAAAPQGHDCGAETIAHQLSRQGVDPVPSVSTIWRILRREGLVAPQPQKRPGSSLIRFEAELPNEMWQADITHWRLADGRDVEILKMIDDHSRLFLASRAFPTAKAVDVVDVFRSAIDLHGVPASLLCDNGGVFTADSRGAARCSCRSRWSAWASPPRTRGPTTARLRQGRAAAPDAEALPAKADPGEDAGRAAGTARCLRRTTTTRSGHRALGGRTPLQAYSARIKARPADYT